jgi:hypothetical protein
LLAGGALAPFFLNGGAVRTVRCAVEAGFGFLAAGFAFAAGLARGGAAGAAAAAAA